MTFEDNELTQLRRDFGTASRKVAQNSQIALERTARSVKDDAKDLAQGIGAHAKHYPRSIGYDMFYGLQQTQADIGPDKAGPQGALGNLLEYGSVNNGPSPHLGPALVKNTEDFIRGQERAAEDFL